MLFNRKKSVAKMLFLLCSLMLSLVFQSVLAFEQKVIKANGLYFWTENFGRPKDPALILIMGSGGQGLLWPQTFCEQLADKGYFVIRYDHRDTGLSSTIDYQKTPYTLVDMAKDVTFILDGYGIQKSHVVGASMGGVIAMIFSANYPLRTQSLTLLATTSDMRATFDALEGVASKSTLSKPSEALLQSAKSIVKPPETVDEKVEAFLQNLRINAGPIIPLDEKMVRELATQSAIRMRNPESANNHFQAIKASYDLQRLALSKIKAPTRIIHGDQDPVFGLDHATALKKAIPQSKLVIIPGLGHGLWNEQLYAPVINNIVDIAKS
jgi:pimeloyl-ACP methyl ester carboxylesterase